MAIGNRHSAGTIWLPTGNPDTTNISNADFNSLGGQPGGLGLKFETQAADRTYQRVKLDSGATASSSSGVVAANQLAYWKDKTQALVTNDTAQALGGSGAANSAFRNFIAGIFRTAVTAGSYCDILVRGTNINVKTTGSPAIGDTLVGDTSTTAAQGAFITAGSAITLQKLGVARGAAVANVTPCDINIEEVQ